METITLTEVKITNTLVIFKSSCTTYAYEVKAQQYDINDLLKRCTVLCKKLKGMGCKISHKNKTRKTLKDNIDTYEKELSEYNHNFNMLKNYAQWITSKPLPVGTSDNEELNTMYEFSNKCTSALNRSTVLSKVIDFGNRIEDLEQELEHGECSYSTIYF